MYLFDTYEKKFYGAFLGVAGLRSSAIAVDLGPFAFAVRGGLNIIWAVADNAGILAEGFHVADHFSDGGVGVLADPPAEQVPGAVMGT